MPPGTNARSTGTARPMGPSAGGATYGGRPH
jgi:hypothetical protein